MERTTNRSNQLKNAYIVTRPIQYINVLNIPDNNINVKALLLVDTFAGANEFAKVQQESVSCVWNEIIVFKDVYNALQWAVNHKSEIDSLYTFSDYGVKIHWYLNKLPNVNIYLYEEGTATYVSRFQGENSLQTFILRFLNKTWHTGSYIGSYSRTKAIYAYNTELFKKLKPFCKRQILPFNNTLFDHLKNNKDSLDYFMYKELPSVIPSKVLMYLSGWDYNDEVEKI